MSFRRAVETSNPHGYNPLPSASLAELEHVTSIPNESVGMEYYRPIGPFESDIEGAIPPHATVHSKLGAKATLQLVPTRGVSPTEGPAAWAETDRDDFGLHTLFVNSPLMAF
jgi:hypothetical protein